MDFWDALKEFGLPILFLVIVLVGFGKLWKHHVTTTNKLVEEKKNLETEVRELYKEIVAITSESQKILGEVIPLLRRRE